MDFVLIVDIQDHSHMVLDIIGFPIMHNHMSTDGNVEYVCNKRYRYEPAVLKHLKNIHPL